MVLGFKKNSFYYKKRPLLKIRSVLHNFFIISALKTYRKKTRAKLETVEYLKAQEAMREASNQMEFDTDNLEVHRGIDSDIFSGLSRNSLSR